MQALGANRFVQGVRQHLHCLGHLRHTLAFIQKCLGLLFHFALRVQNFSNCARFLIHEPGQFEERIFRGRYSRSAAVIQLLANAHVTHFRIGNQLRGACAR